MSDIQLDSSPSTTARVKPKGWLLGSLICFVGVFGLYLFTIAPVVQGFDSAELTVGAYTLGYVHAPGYPLYMLLGHLFTWLPVGNVGLRLNLMSASFGGVAVVLLFWLIVAQTKDWPTAFVAAALFATTPIFWSQAVRAEVYTLQTLLEIAILFCCWHAFQNNRVFFFRLCFILLGIGMAHHLTTALLWLSIVIFSIVVHRKWILETIVFSMVGIVVASLFYLYFFWRSSEALQIDYIRPYFHVDTAGPGFLWWLVSARSFKCFFYLNPLPLSLAQEATRLFLSIWDNLLGFGIIVAAWGWIRVRKQNRLWNDLLLIYFCINVVGFLAYHAIDKEVMFIPLYFISVIWIASGISGLITWVSLRLQMVAAKQVAMVVMGTLLCIIATGVWLHWPSVSLRSDRRIYNFAVQLLGEVEPSTIIVNHWVTASVFDYARVVDRQRPDVSSFNLEFYFLGLQQNCDVSDNAAAQKTWFTWIEDHMQQPLCFIEPLPPIPNTLDWVQRRNCWTLAKV